MCDLVKRTVLARDGISEAHEQVHGLAAMDLGFESMIGDWEVL
jgi:hypothetical protein